MRTQALILILLTIFGLFFGSSKALALDIPNFPACNNPQGTIKVQYSNGIHGIIGDSNQYTGSDTVYQLDNGNLMQCFCAVSGQGIQTNWWKVSALNQEEIQILKNSGWVYVPNGTLWGLEETAYFAKNANFSCGSNNNSNNNSGNSSSSGGGVGGGEILSSGISTSIGEVLGLASTGGGLLPFVFAIIGILALGFGFFLHRKASGK